MLSPGQKREPACYQVDHPLSLSKMDLKQGFFMWEEMGEKLLNI